MKTIAKTALLAATLGPALLAGTALRASSAPARDGLRVGAELPVTAMDNAASYAHNSPLLIADPKDERIVALASRTDNPDFDCYLHISGNRGTTWLEAPAAPKLPSGVEKCYAPEMAFDAAGRLNYLFIGLSGLGNNPTGVYLVKSTENGYTAPRRVLGPERYMARMAIDKTIGPHGRMHLVWLQAGADPPTGGLAVADNPLMAAYSDDGGRTFSKPVRVSDAGRPRTVAPALAVGKDHSVHVLYYDLKEDSRDYQGLEGPAWEGTWSLVMATSTNSGRSFGRGVEVDAGLVPPERVMLIYTMPPPSLAAGPDGTLYAAWHDARNGDWDTFVSRSNDRGSRWTLPRRLNDDPLKNGKHQHMPRLAVAPNGRLDAVFYDRRNDAANQKAHIYFTSSADRGANFTPNHRITAEPSDTMVGPRYPIPSAKNLVEFGSRIGLLSRDGGALAAWTDTRHSFSDGFQQEIYASRIRIPGQEDVEGSPSWIPWALGVGAGLLIAVGLAAWRASPSRFPRREKAA